MTIRESSSPAGVQRRRGIPLGTHRRWSRGRLAPLVAVIDELPTPHLIRALTLRLDGIVALDRLEAALRPTVEAVLAGPGFCPLSSAAGSSIRCCSAREKQVLAIVALVLANLEIAHKLFVTEASVKTHLRIGVRQARRATGARRRQR